MPAITLDDFGRFAVSDERRQYGAYRSAAMALYRAKQVAASRRPCPGARWKRPENRKGVRP